MAGRLAVLCAAVLGFTMNVIVSAWTGKPDRDMVVERLALVDGEGREVAVLDARDGVPELRFMGPDGRVRAGIGLAQHETGAVSGGSPVLFLGLRERPDLLAGIETLLGKEIAALTLGKKPFGPGIGCVTRLEASTEASAVHLMSVDERGVVPRVLVLGPAEGMSSVRLYDDDGEVTHSVP